MEGVEVGFAVMEGVEVGFAVMEGVEVGFAVVLMELSIQTIFVSLCYTLSCQFSIVLTGECIVDGTRHCNLQCYH